MPSDHSLTPQTLLRRLRAHPDDPSAWGEFVAHYGPRIYNWTRRWGVQSADAEDVTQAVLLKLAVKLREFEYDPTRSFRGWLKTLTHHAWRDHAQRQGQPGGGSGDDAVTALLDQLEARESLAKCLEEAYDLEIFREAMMRVQLRVEPRTWQAFHLMTFDALSGVEVASRLGMKTATVFVARSKVLRMLREETVRIERDESS